MLRYAPAAKTNRWPSGGRTPVANQEAIASIAVPRNFHDRDGHLLRVHVEFLLHDLGDALHGPPLLFDRAAFQHGDLYVRHSTLPGPTSLAEPVYFAISNPAKK